MKSGGRYLRAWEWVFRRAYWAIIACCPLAACSAPAGGNRLFELGTSASEPAAPVDGLRIVSLDAGLTEIIFELGLGENVVGITDWCHRPRGKLTGIPRLGSALRPDIERLLRLAPNLILLSRQKNLPGQVSELSAATAATIVVWDAYTPTDIARQAGRLAKWLDLPARATAAFDELLEAERSASPGLARKYLGKKVFIDFAPRKPPFYSLGAETVLGALLTKAGAILMPGARPYPAYDLEGVSRFMPDRIVAPVWDLSAAGAVGNGLSVSEATAEERAVRDFWRRMLPGVPIDPVPAELADLASPALGALLAALSGGER